jgi:hypothetical protein
MDSQRTSPRFQWVRLIIDHDPFFLLSAICMMAGCHALSLALYTPAGDVGKLLFLLAVINVYEAALIGLGLLLIRRRGMVRRDAHTLLALEAFFLTDLTFISGVIVTVNAAWGWGVIAALFALAIVKVTIIARTLRLPRINRIAAMILIQLGCAQ